MFMRNIISLLHRNVNVGVQTIIDWHHSTGKERAAAEADAERHHGQPAYATDLESERLEKVLEELELSDAESARKEALVEEGFGSWNRRDFRAYVIAPAVTLTLTPKL